jgi:hypothetical protein
VGDGGDVDGESHKLLISLHASQQSLHRLEVHRFAFRGGEGGVALLGEVRPQPPPHLGRCHNYVIITSYLRHIHVIVTSLLRHYYIMWGGGGRGPIWGGATPATAPPRKM